MTPIRLVLSLLFCAAAAVSVADDDFTPLFNGKNLDGWVQRGGEATYEVDADADGGAQIIGTSVAKTPNSFLCTDRDYDDFVLEFDVKVDPSLNSGVQFRSQCFDEAKSVTLNWNGKEQTYKIPAGRVHGYQVEIDPSDRAWSGGVYDEARRGWLYNLEGDARAKARGAFKVDDWNHYRVEAHGDHISTSINGVPVAHFHDSVTPSGFIALQVHAIPDAGNAGKQIRWRNIQIREIAE
ncbi:hypothetical protein Pla108_15180 [Botrimarina colliarenosi]|uniref:3-keto-alpha-glucoside-1,2-lyase/3-keto-2-hydroxy-glucal hydratase domain-containing protein n=1 Tax=Botrimarina colliarenosi TaxID=2528001 RepID=A0A5C6AN77_9BACT|nr:DUF1080 domain-containing protein [Botrimarina colliarenosi]TWU00566.1 hypothetical protein Pla108_15180 [Botrimarina colliarenosi]